MQRGRLRRHLIERAQAEVDEGLARELHRQLVERQRQHSALDTVGGPRSARSGAIEEAAAAAILC